MDDQEGISSIKNCACDPDYFYIFANKKHRMLGYYFLRFPVKNPEPDVKIKDKKGNPLSKTEYFI